MTDIKTRKIIYRFAILFAIIFISSSILGVYLFNFVWDLGQSEYTYHTFRPIYIFFIVYFGVFMFGYFFVVSKILRKKGYKSYEMLSDKKLSTILALTFIISCGNWVWGSTVFINVFEPYTTHLNMEIELIEFISYNNISIEEIDGLLVWNLSYTIDDIGKLFQINIETQPSVYISKINDIFINSTTDLSKSDNICFSTVLIDTENVMISHLVLISKYDFSSFYNVTVF